MGNRLDRGWHRRGPGRHHLGPLLARPRHLAQPLEIGETPEKSEESRLLVKADTVQRRSELRESW